MANVFDQFDEQEDAPQEVVRERKGDIGAEPPEGNIFDQFDQPRRAAPENTFDQFDQEQPLPESSAIGAAARGAAESAIPTTAGIGAGLLTGGALSAVATPWVGIPAGIAVGFGAGELVNRGQDWVLDKLGLREGQGFFSNEQKLADTTEHPYAQTAGSLGPSALLLRPGLGTLAAGQRLVGAAIGGGVQAGHEWLTEGHVDPIKAGMAAAVGAALPFTNRAGSAIANAGVRKPGTDFTLQGDPYGPEPPRRPGPTTPLEGEVIPPEQRRYTGDQNVDRDLQFAYQNRDEFIPNDPMWNFWNEHINDLQSRAGKGNAASDREASRGPPKDGEFTYTEPADMERSNDLTTTARGVAADNPPAPNIPGAGNPVGSPMFGRIAQRPGEPGRDYRKSTPALRGETEGAPSTRMSTAPIHEDVLATFAADEAPRLPAPPEQRALPAPEQFPEFKVRPEQAANLDQRLGQRQWREAGAQRRAQQDTIPSEKYVAETGQQARETLAGEPVREVTAAVTPEQQQVVRTVRQALQKANMPEVLRRLDALPPEAQARAAQGLHDALSKQSSPVTTAGEERAPVQRAKVATGVQARSKADAARKQGVLDAYDKAVAEHPPAEGEVPVPTAAKDKAALVDRLTKMVARADELSGGQKYRPNVKPPSWQLVQAARKVIAKPTPANIQAYRTAEAALAKGKTEDIQASKDFQDTGRIEADIAKRPQLPEAAAEAQINKTAEDTRGRVEHEPFTNEHGDESVEYTVGQNTLRNWLNNLGDAQEAKLRELHPELELNVKTTQDPVELMHNLMDDLAEAEGKRPGVIEPIPVETAPVSKVTPIKTRADIKKADTGRVLDKNSPEFKKAAAEALARINKPKALEITAPVDEAPKAPKPKVKDLYDKFTQPVDGTEGSLADHWSRFMADESGAVPLPRLARKMADWMKTSVRDFFTPHADPATIDYGNQIGLKGVKLNTDITRIKANALAAARSATLPDGSVPTPTQMGQMYRAKESRSLNRLSQPMRDYFDTHVQPYIDRAGQAYDELRDTTMRLRLPGWDTMPERKTNGPGFMDWMPRRRQFSVEDLDYDPITNRGLSNWAQSAQERDWFTLQNLGTGARKVFRVNEDGDMVFYQNHRAGRAKTPPQNFDPRDIGAELAMNNGQRWKVDHSSIDELMAHGNGENGKPLVYSQNPVFTALDAYIGLKSALARVKLLDNVLNDPAFQAMAVRKKAVAEQMYGKNNFDETILPQLAGRFLPKPVAWAFDDLVKTGFDYGSSTFLHGLARFTQATLKPFFFFGPEVHVFNEADKFLVGRGWDNVTPKGISSAARNFLGALRSVRRQDATQVEIMDAGGNPMFAHSATSRIMPQIGKLVGEDIVTQPYKYDPLFKHFGVNTKDVLANLYQQSTKFMWWQSDVLYTTLYKEARERGMSPRDAVVHTEHVIDSYVVPTTFGKSVGMEATDAGRFLQKVLTDPITANFGRFHYGLYHMVAQIVKNMLGPNSTMGDRVRGAGQAAMLLAMANIVYPALSAGYAKITGNESSEFEKRGVTKLVSTPFQLAHGEKEVPDLLRNLWSPSTVVDSLRIFGNRDFTGKKILDASGGWGRVPGQAAEFAAGQAVSPYKTISTAAQQGGPGWVAQRFLESNVGLKTPSPAAEKFQMQRPRTQARDARTRERHPKGLIERGGNWLTE